MATHHEITGGDSKNARFSCSCGSEIHPDTSSDAACLADMLPWLRTHAAEALWPDLRAIPVNDYTGQYNDSDGHKAAQVVRHADGGCVVRFGYADTTIRDPKNKMAMPKVIAGQFEECHGTPSRAYKTQAGATKAALRWIR